MELVDLYPTLADLAGLPVGDHLEGVSLRPLLEDPKADWKHVAISTLGQNNHAVRDERWKYIRYNELDDMDELYDLVGDPYELKNVIDDPADHMPCLDQIRERLRRVGIEHVTFQLEPRRLYQIPVE